MGSRFMFLAAYCDQTSQVPPVYNTTVKLGYNKLGYNKPGYNKLGFNKLGYNNFGYNKLGYNKLGYNKLGYNKLGCNKLGYNKLLLKVNTLETLVWFSVSNHNMLVIMNRTPVKTKN